MREAEQMLIKYHTDIEKIVVDYQKGNWIDLRAAETVEFKQGDHKLISLGVSIQLPHGYEAHVVPRSSTFKNYGIIQANHIGIIDYSYSGDNDIWMFSAYATRDAIVNKNDRICQFKIVPIQPMISVKEVEFLSSPDRGGFGSTGVK